MTVSLTIQLVNFVPSTPVKDKIESKLLKLNRIEKDIRGCRIIIKSHYDGDSGNHFYEVRMNLIMGNNVIITNRYSNTLKKYEDINIAIWRAFISIRQQLKFYHRSQLHDEAKNNSVPLASGIRLRLHGVAGNV